MFRGIYHYHSLEHTYQNLHRKVYCGINQTLRGQFLWIVGYLQVHGDILSQIYLFYWYIIAVFHNLITIKICG